METGGGLLRESALQKWVLLMSLEQDTSEKALVVSCTI